MVEVSFKDFCKKSGYLISRAKALPASRHTKTALKKNIKTILFFLYII
jgi:hypothetical protein